MSKHGLSVRGDCLYCPLPLSIDPYNNCLVDCHHCYMRRLNHVWGKELKPLDPEALRKKLTNGLKNKNPKSSMANCLARKKTIRIGNKADGFQPIEDDLHITAQVIQILEELEWSYVIQTRFLSRVWEFGSDYRDALSPRNAVILPIISPGLEMDWEILERRRTDPPRVRLRILKEFRERGFHGGVNGEPFIPGYHTVQDFEDTLKTLRDYGIDRYNTYNLHLNDYVLKRLNDINLDIEKIWTMNQDKNWKPIQQQLCDLAKKHNIILGCPDFVNTGPDWKEEANTCCGIDVPNPSRFNTHYFKKTMQAGVKAPNAVLTQHWEGIGEFEEALKIVQGKRSDMYTMADAGLVKKPKKGLIV